ncbi:hypothetical protein [Pendulispora albinea]|uniref:Uncharacterized protein n=1 Tax=Pendulispora albinea TaxID=2741071 RepID=A0ABZ2LV03_9BACT
MHLYDVLAVIVLVLGAVAFVLGALALARADDLIALYWMVAGLTTMRASVQIARSGVRG